MVKQVKYKVSTSVNTRTNQKIDFDDRVKDMIMVIARTMVLTETTSKEWLNDRNERILAVAMDYDTKVELIEVLENRSKHLYNQLCWDYDKKQQKQDKAIKIMEDEIERQASRYRQDKKRPQYCIEEIEHEDIKRVFGVLWDWTRSAVEKIERMNLKASKRNYWEDPHDYSDSEQSEVDEDDDDDFESYTSESESSDYDEE